PQLLKCIIRFACYRHREISKLSKFKALKPNLQLELLPTRPKGYITSPPKLTMFKSILLVGGSSPSKSNLEDEQFIDENNTYTDYIGYVVNRERQIYLEMNARSNQDKWEKV